MSTLLLDTSFTQTKLCSVARPIDSSGINLIKQVWRECESLKASYACFRILSIRRYVLLSTHTYEPPICAAKRAVSDNWRGLPFGLKGLVAVFERPNLALPSSASLALICDEIRDPGNLGTLLRSAASAGVDGVILTTGCADVWGLKVLRGGMGAQFRVPIRANQSWDKAMEIVRAWDCKVRVADGEGENYTALDWKGRYAVVIGGEADGPGERAFEESEKIVGIRLGGGMESLNAAVAGSIILFEARRQRGQ